MPSHDHCCVPCCTNRRSKCPGVSFHLFPKAEPLRKQWIVAIKRDEGCHFQVTSSTVVCSAHFQANDFYVPPSGQEDVVAVRRRLKACAVPSRFAFGQEVPVRPSPTERRAAASRRLETYHEKASLPTFGPQTKLEATQEELRYAKKRIEELEAANTSLREENARLRSQVFRYDNIKDDGAQLAYLTGLTQDMWRALWQYLKPSRADVLSAQSAESESKGRVNAPGAGRKPVLSMEDELLVTLMRLRLGRQEQDLAYQFGLSKSSVSRISVKWINFLYLRLGLIPIWPTWQDVEKTMPAAFQETYPTTCAIIDATELKCEIPSSLSLQSQHYSGYKSHTTVKGLVAIAPNGSFMFVSQLYTGSISDRQLFQDSGILDLLEDMPRGKSLMADRGFEVQDLLVKQGLLLNIPPFKGSKKSLTVHDVKKTQRIARLRIHVERAIGQVKSRFRLFQTIIPITLCGSINQLWTVACLLINFCGPIIGENPDVDDE